MIDSVDHIGIAVESIDEARALWESLGLRVGPIEEVPEDRVRVAWVDCGGSRIELLEPTGPDSPIARFLAKRGPGIHHVCVSSDDIRADDARLRRAGHQLVRPQPTRGAGGSWVQFIHPRSMGGVLVEMTERDDGDAEEKGP